LNITFEKRLILEKLQKIRLAFAYCNA